MTPGQGRLRLLRSPDGHNSTVLPGPDDQRRQPDLPIGDEPHRDERQRGNPDGVAVLVSAELCSLNFAALGADIAGLVETAPT